MKFGKSLSNQIEETIPEWRDKFLSYKELKKTLKLVGGVDRLPAAKRVKISARDEEAMTKEVEEFLKLLEDELEKFNGFFVEKEEEYIILQKELQDQAAKAEVKGSIEELMKVRKEIVDFHGEMVLLENYSALNYTGLVKILKKYDKRTGALIRLPFIQKVLQQPFFTTDLLNKLVKECESMLDRLFPKSESSIVDMNEDPGNLPESSSIKGEIPDLDEIEYMEGLYVKGTISALKVLKEIRRGSSTVSVFSLPPLQPNGGEERAWDKVSAIEQLAK